MQVTNDLFYRVRFFTRVGRKVVPRNVLHEPTSLRSCELRIDMCRKILETQDFLFRLRKPFL